MEIKEIELKDRTITIFNDVDESTMSSAVEKIVQINQEDDAWIRNVYSAMEASGAKFSPTTIEMPHIQILLSTYGGSVYDGMAIVDTMNYINSEVGTTCVGLAASMGSIILSSGEKGKRLILPHSRVLIHQPLGGCKGQASEIEIEYREIQKVKQELYEVLAANTGQSYDRIYADADRDHWFTAIEAEEYGLVDEVIYKKK